MRDAAAVGITRAKVAAILKSAEPPSNNNITQEEESLKELKRNPEIVVLKADEGNGTVIMDSKDYDQKVNAMLTNECTYVKLPDRPNPINQISATVNQYVWNLYQHQKINQKCYYQLHRSNAVFLDSMAHQKSTNQLRLSVLLFRLLIRPHTIYQNFCLVF